jgi:16S rRNA (cytidine1402-2'-O)-methyltransferase
LLRICHRDTHLCIAANLTADDEFIGTRSIAGWSASRPVLHKIPAMYLLGTA